jgi:hypothetical protein
VRRADDYRELGSERTGGVAVAGGYAYWTTEQSILSVPTTGGATNTVASGVSALDIAAHDDRLFWIDVGGSLSAVHVAGATPQVLASGFGNLGGLAVDDSNAYFTERCSAPDASCAYVGGGAAAAAGTGRLLSVPLAGGAVTTLATEQLNPISAIVDTPTFTGSTRERRAKTRRTRMDRS